MTEIIDGKEIPSFRGDIINGFEISQRTPDPTRLVRWARSAQLLLENIWADGIAHIITPRLLSIFYVANSHPGLRTCTIHSNGPLATSKVARQRRNIKQS